MEYDEGYIFSVFLLSFTCCSMRPLLHSRLAHPYDAHTRDVFAISLACTGLSTVLELCDLKVGKGRS